MPQIQTVQELKTHKLKTLLEKKSKVLFGEYLLHREKIDEDDLELALKFQEEEYVALGALAVRENFLSSQQLSAVLDHQRMEGHGKFGEIAIELGFLNNETVDKLLAMQKEKHILIGDILVLFGAISKEEMKRELKQFHELEGHD